MMGSYPELEWSQGMSALQLFILSLSAYLHSQSQLPATVCSEITSLMK